MSRDDDYPCRECGSHDHDTLVHDDTPCGRPAPHLSADRRRPVCGEHVEREDVTA